MEDSLAFVNLNCLNCGANLKITESIFEFACQYCGATQIVERAGGVVALRYFSDKIDRVQTSVDKTHTELKLQRLISDLEDLEERHARIKEAIEKLKSMINPIAISVLVVIAVTFFVITAFTNSIFPLLFGGAIEFIIFWLWRIYIHRLDADYNKTVQPLRVKSLTIREKIAELENLVEF